MEQTLNAGERLYNLTDVSYPFFAIVRSRDYNKVFRAFVLGKHPGRNFEVYFCDWGNTEIVPPENIFKAPEGVNLLPAAAIPATLTNQKTEYVEWTPDMVKSFMRIMNKAPILKVDVKVSANICISFKFLVESIEAYFFNDNRGMQSSAEIE